MNEGVEGALAAMRVEEDHPSMHFVICFVEETGCSAQQFSAFLRSVGQQHQMTLCVFHRNVRCAHLPPGAPPADQSVLLDTWSDVYVFAEGKQAGCTAFLTHFGEQAPTVQVQGRPSDHCRRCLPASPTATRKPHRVALACIRLTHEHLPRVVVLVLILSSQMVYREWTYLSPWNDIHGKRKRDASGAPSAVGSVDGAAAKKRRLGPPGLRCAEFDSWDALALLWRREFSTALPRVDLTLALAVGRLNRGVRAGGPGGGFRRLVPKRKVKGKGKAGGVSGSVLGATGPDRRAS
jgi:hypothetical protein